MFSITVYNTITPHAVSPLAAEGRRRQLSLAFGEHKPGRIKPGRIKRAALSLQNQNYEF